MGGGDWLVPQEARGRSRWKTGGPTESQVPCNRDAWALRLWGRGAAGTRGRKEKHWRGSGGGPCTEGGWGSSQGREAHPFRKLLSNGLRVFIRGRVSDLSLVTRPLTDTLGFAGHRVSGDTSRTCCCENSRQHHVTAQLNFTSKPGPRAPFSASWSRTPRSHSAPLVCPPPLCSRACPICCWLNAKRRALCSE